MPINIRVDTRQVQIELDNVSNIFRNLKDEGLWDHLLRRPLRPELNEVFRTDGYGTWVPRKDNLPHPLLRKTRRLFRSLTRRNSPGNINRQSQRNWTWGTSIRYAQYHEQPERPFSIPRRAWFRTMLEQGDFDRKVETSVDTWANRKIREKQKRS